jgi:hypothetical protein
LRYQYIWNIVVVRNLRPIVAKLPENGSRFDGLAETNFICKEVADNWILENPSNHLNLVRK